MKNINIIPILLSIAFIYFYLFVLVYGFGFPYDDQGIPLKEYQHPNYFMQLIKSYWNPRLGESWVFGNYRLDYMYYYVLSPAFFIIYFLIIFYYTKLRLTILPITFGIIALLIAMDFFNKYYSLGLGLVLIILIIFCYPILTKSWYLTKLANNSLQARDQIILDASKNMKENDIIYVEYCIAKDFLNQNIMQPDFPIGNASSFGANGLAIDRLKIKQKIEFINKGFCEIGYVKIRE